MNKNYFLLLILFFLIIGCGKDKQKLVDPAPKVSESKEEIKIDVQKPQFVCWITSQEGLRVRDFPDLQGNKIGLLNYKEEVEVFEIGKKELIDNKLAFWLKIRFENQYGWIFGGYVTIIPEEICVENENLPLTEKSLAGTWTQSTDSSSITDFRFGEIFEENGKYYSGMLYSSIGTMGTYTIDDKNQEILLVESAIDEEYMSVTKYEYKLKVKKLTSDELIYEYTDKKDIPETIVRQNHRIPQRFLELKNASTIEWLKYINKYGNEELFTGSTVFMYSVLLNQNDVALFLINSDIDINHINKSGAKAANFLRENKDNFISEILKSESEEKSLSDSNDLLEQKLKGEQKMPSVNSDELFDFKPIEIKSDGWVL